MAKIAYSDHIVSYNDDPETVKAVFDKVLEFFTKYQAYSGEHICQSDNPIIAAPSLLGEIADDIIKFDIEWEDE